MTPSDKEYERQHALKMAVTYARALDPWDEWDSFDAKRLAVHVQVAIMWAKVADALR